MRSLLSRYRLVVWLLLATHALVAPVFGEEGETTDPFLPTPRRETGRWELLPTITISAPTDLILQLDRYKTTYAGQFEGMPLVQVGAARQMAQFGDFDWLLQTTIGYGSRAGNYEVGLDRGGSTRDNVRLDWIPMSLATRFNYNVPGLRLRPSLAAGVGGSWFIQSGTLPGFSTQLLVPFLTVTPAITLLDQAAGGDWFGGFTFGITVFRSFSSAQLLQGTSFDLSVRILL